MQCIATQGPYRLLGGPGIGKATLPATKNNSFLSGSGTDYETVTFGCCTGNCGAEEPQSAVQPTVPGRGAGNCADGLPGTPPKIKTDCPAGVHCATCRDGADVKADDCITCEENCTHVPAIPGGEPDCTGTCQKKCTPPPGVKMPGVRALQELQGGCGDCVGLPHLCGRLQL